MFRNLSTTTQAATFYGLTLVMVTALALSGAGTAAAMLTPFLATLIMLLVVTREGWRRTAWADLGLHRLGLRTWPIAVLAPVGVIMTGGAVAVVAGVAGWDPAPGGQIALVQPLLWPAVFLVNVLFASLTVSLTEEIGWRGYLLPRLLPLGERRAMVLSGFLHGFWHVPVILLTGLYLSEGNRLLVIAMFLCTVTAVGVFLGWLRLRTGSVWPAVLAHSAHNVAVAWSADALAGDAAMTEHLAGESGVVTLLAYAALAVVLARTVRRTSPSTAAARPLAECGAR